MVRGAAGRGARGVGRTRTDLGGVWREGEAGPAGRRTGGGCSGGLPTCWTAPEPPRAGLVRAPYEPRTEKETRGAMRRSKAGHPAWAGHPRLRGDHTFTLVAGKPWIGPPPHVRGPHPLQTTDSHPAGPPRSRRDHPFTLVAGNPYLGPTLPGQGPLSRADCRPARSRSRPTCKAGHTQSRVRHKAKPHIPVGQPTLLGGSAAARSPPPARAAAPHGGRPTPIPHPTPAPTPVGSPANAG